MRVASGGRGSYTGNMYPPYPRTPFFAFFPVFFGVNRGYVAHFVCTPDVPPTYPGNGSYRQGLFLTPN